MIINGLIVASAGDYLWWAHPAEAGLGSSLHSIPIRMTDGCINTMEEAVSYIVYLVISFV